MANSNERYIETGRAQLFVDVTVHEQPGEGNITLSGVAGSVDGILVGGVTQILPSAVPFNTTLNQTALDVADAINNNITAPNYHARAVGAVVYVWQQTIVAGTVTIVTSTTTLGAADVNIGGGVIGDGTPLGDTEQGFEFTLNDEYLEETTEESGIRKVKAFHLAENVEITAVFKQWDEDVLNLRYAGRHTTAGGVNRIEVPGSLTPGDSAGPLFRVMELRPTNKAYPTLLIRKGQALGNANEPTRFRTQEVKKTGVLIACYKDDNHVATAYATVGIDLAQNLQL